jgi:Microsomal signal peptidase 25 kDa subunit (SPC25)
MSGAPTRIDPSGLYDVLQVKRVLDDNVISVLEECGYTEATAVSNVKIVAGVVAIVAALYSHFNPLEFPDNRNLILICVTIYSVCVAIATGASWIFERNAIYVGRLTSSASLTTRGASHPPAVWAQSVLGPAGTSTYTIQLRTTVADKKATDPESTASTSKPYESYFSESGELAVAAFREEVKSVLRKLGAAHRRIKRTSDAF